MACDNDIITPDPNECSCPPIGFKTKKTTIANEELTVVVNCYIGGNQVHAIIAAGVFVETGKTQEEVNADCLEFYTAQLRQSIDCDTPVFTAVDAVEIGDDLPLFADAYLGGAWFGATTINTPPEGVISAAYNEQFNLSENTVCAGGPDTGLEQHSYCPSDVASLSPVFDTRPINWSTRGSGSDFNFPFSNAPVFGQSNTSAHTFFYGSENIPPAADDAFSTPRASVRRIIDPTLYHGKSGVGPELFSEAPATDTLLDGVLSGHVSVIQGHDGELWGALASDYNEITLRGPASFEVVFAGRHPRMFTSRVFTGRESTSDTYCFYTDEGGVSLYVRRAADNFGTETEVVEFPAPVQFIQDINRVNDRLVLWALTTGSSVRDVRQLVMFSGNWSDESIKYDTLTHEAAVSEGAIYQSAFDAVEGGAEDTTEHSSEASFGALTDSGTEFIRETARHYAGVLLGAFTGETTPLSFTELADHTAGVVRGIRHSASAAVLEHARHYAGVESGERT